MLPKPLVEELRRNGAIACAVSGNLNVPGDRNSLITRAAKGLGAPLSALINNASTFSPDSAATITDGMFDHHINANLRAPLMLSRDFAAQTDRGSIINIIDQRVLKPNPAFFSYAISKSALYAATKTLAQSFAPGIRVNAIGPGPTLQNIHQKKSDFEAERDGTLLGIGSSPDAIVEAVKYLLAANSVTGQMIAVDGGQHLNFTLDEGT